MRFAPARAEAFERAQEPDRRNASPATTRGILFLSRQWARGSIGPRVPTSHSRFLISPNAWVRFPSSRGRLAAIGSSSLRRRPDAGHSN
jgi:hypothetical protein